jgi:transcriptional regulator with XRE-family HTH domain
MSFGENLLAWPRHLGYTQVVLAAKAGIAQPNLVGLEGNRLEPKLSTIQRLAASLGISAGKLLDQRPPQASWNRHRIDALVREAVTAKTSTSKRRKWAAEALRIIASGKLGAAGHRVTLNGRTGERLIKQLQADLGPRIWKEVVRRLDKHIVDVRPKSKTIDRDFK